MKKKQTQDTPVIVIPKGYGLTEMLDTDDSGYDFEDEAIYCGEVKVSYERR